MKRKQMVRFIALLLVILLAGGAVVSALVSALAEETAPARDSHQIEMEYIEEKQALHISQRLFYHNPSDTDALNSVVFYATANMFRRESALIYENDVLQSVFPSGYAPAGIDLQSVKVDGQIAEWGYRGENEMQLRVACALAPGESAVFDFDYYLLLSECRAFTGVYETDVRLSAFLITPGIYSDTYHEYFLNAPLQHTTWMYAQPADYSVTLALPDSYLPAATGEETLLSTEDHISTWRFDAQNVRDFALSFGRRYRESTQTTTSGVRVRILSNHRGSASNALEYATEIIDLYSRWLGDFPVDQIDLVQSDYPVDALNFPGIVWLPEDLFEDSAAMRRALRFCLAQQYLGWKAFADPVGDAWLSDVPCSYLSLLAVEELEGYDAFLTALNDQVLDALKITFPGGLYITADASLFTADEYALVVRDRGTVVMHELRVAMGREALIESLRAFYEIGLNNDVLGEYDLVRALDDTTGGDWENFLTDWLFNVNEYVDQQLEFYE